MNNADKNIELKVKEIIDSKIAFDDSNGDKLFKKIIEVTNGNSQTVILDFDGRLFDKEVYNIEKNRVLIRNMDDTKKDLLKETISNAVKRYSDRVS